MKLIYKPFAILFGVLAGVVAKKLSAWLWSLFDREKAPAANVRQTSWAKVLGAAAVEGLTFKVTRAAVDRGGAQLFENLTGVWPGPRQPESEEE